MDVQELFQVIVLGVVQGIAEFLPISSSGHLVIVNELLTGGVSQPEGDLAMNIALHLGTLGSILVVFRRDLKAVLFDWKMILAVIVATLPIVIVGLTLKDLVESAFETPAVAAGGLLVTSFLLWLCEWLEPAGEAHAIDETHAGSESEYSPSFKQAISIGLFQALAVVPGISRSGSTIAGGVMVGLPREMAAKFSFLIAIPAILGATLLHTVDAIKSPDPFPFDTTLLIGAMVAFAVGVFALEALLRIVRKKKLRWFSVYCLCASLATFTWLALRAA